jgi:hypothetical protein
MLSRRDRRQTERFDLEIPLSIRALEQPEAPARMAVSTNISATGLCVATDLMLQVGSSIEISFRMPEGVSGQPSHKNCYKGRVIRVEFNNFSREKLRVGVQLHYYEVLEVEGAQIHNPRSGGQNE